MYRTCEDRSLDQEPLPWRLGSSGHQHIPLYTLYDKHTHIHRNSHFLPYPCQLWYAQRSSVAIILRENSRTFQGLSAIFSRPIPMMLHRVRECLWHHIKTITRMWANAQCDGRPADYRWRPLCNAAKFGWRPLLECRAITLPRHESRWNLQGCPKLANRSQPLGGQVRHIMRTCGGGVGV